MVGDCRSKTDPAMGVKIMKTSRGPEPPLAVKLVSAGTAACIAECFTFPLDTAKVRLQIQGENNTNKSLRTRIQTYKPKYKGVVGTLKVIAQEEGVKGLYNGIIPGLQRQMCFSVVKLGCYDEVKKMYMNLLYKDNKATDMTIGVRVISGITTGALSVCLAQPTDVVKVRMQAQSSFAERVYTSTAHAYRTIAVNEGFLGLWKGYLPNVTRNAIVTVGELVTYDVIKDHLITNHILADSIFCHLISAFGAGFCATIVASPVDVVKTRYMNSAKGQYSGATHCALSVFREGGAKAFYKGFAPALTRLGTWNVIMFLCYEQLKLALSPKPVMTTMNLPG